MSAAAYGITCSAANNLQTPGERLAVGNGAECSFII